MRIDEIYDKSWKIDDNVVIDYTDEQNISLEEQECHFNVDRFEGDKITICCSHQPFITKLSKSSMVIVKRVLITRSESNICLEVQAVADKKLLTIRKATTSMSDENKLKASIRLKEMMNNRK